jgi:hypothetical protein
MTMDSDRIITPDPNLFSAGRGVSERGEDSVDINAAVELIDCRRSSGAGTQRHPRVHSGGRVRGHDRPRPQHLRDPTAEISASEVLRTVFDGLTVYGVA